MKRLFSILFLVLLMVPGTSYGAKWTLKYAHVGPATAVSDDHIPGLWLKTYLESRTGGDHRGGLHSRAGPRRSAAGRCLPGPEFGLGVECAGHWYSSYGGALAFSHAGTELARVPISCFACFGWAHDAGRRGGCRALRHLGKYA